MKDIDMIQEPKVVCDSLKVYSVKNLTVTEGSNGGNLDSIENLLVIDCKQLGADSLIYVDYKTAYSGGVADELLRRGLISGKFVTDHGETINDEIRQYIDENFDKHRCNSVMYSEERLYDIAGQQGFVCGEQMLLGGKAYRAFRRPGDYITEGIRAMKGDPEEFKKFLRNMMKGLTKAQIILAFELSGILRQSLRMKGVDIGELSSVLCVSGMQGSGKTAVTVGLKEMLFGGGVFSGSNITEVAMGRILKEAGVGPSVFDDTSADVTSNSKKVCALIRQIYNMSSGRARVISTSNRASDVYSPMVQSRELNYSLGNMVKSFVGLSGFEVRLIELIVDKYNEFPENLLAWSKEHADQYALGKSKFSGQALQFIKCFLEKHQDRIVEQYEDMKKHILEIKQNDKELDELDDRVANRDAVIALSGSIANDAYDLGLDVDEIIRALLKSHIVLHRKRKAQTPNQWLINVACMYAYGNKYDHRVVAKDTITFDVRKNMVARKVSKGRETLIIPVKASEFVFDQEWGNLKDYDDNTLTTPDSTWSEWPAIFKKNEDLLGIRSSGAVMLSKAEVFKTALREWEYQGILIKGNRGYSNSKSLGGVHNIPCYELDIENMLQATNVFAPVSEEMFARIKDKDEVEKKKNDIVHLHEEKSYEELGI